MPGSAQCRNDRNTMSLDLRDSIWRMKKRDNDDGDNNNNYHSKGDCGWNYACLFKR
jgi:hypothetical protein